MLVVAAILTLAVVDSKRQGWVLRVVRHICYDVGDVFVVVVVAVFVVLYCSCHAVLVIVLVVLVVLGLGWRMTGRTWGFTGDSPHLLRC